MEFHKNGAATKKECLNALMVEDTKFKVKECVRVVNLLNWRYFVKLITADPFKIELLFSENFIPRKFPRIWYTDRISYRL